MSPVASVTADRRFRRAHVKPARRRAGRRALIKRAAASFAMTLVASVAFYQVALLVVHARVLTVDRIVVSGNERLSKGDVIAVLSGLRGESLLFTDLHAWRRRLLASPWIRDAALRRSLPSTVDVTVLERRPVGIGRLNGELYLVDERGIVIDQFGPQYADLDLPIIDGLAGHGDTMTDEPRADLASRVIAAARSKPAIAKRLSQIDVSDAHNASVILAGDPAVLQLGEEQFIPRLESYLGLSAALHERVADIDAVDLRFDDRIYVRPAKPATATRKKRNP
jgi:cell division protein FtsQ